MRLRVGVSPGLVFSGRRLSSRPSNIPLSLLLLSLGPQLKNEWELSGRRAAMVRECACGHLCEMAAAEPLTQSHMKPLAVDAV